MERSWSLSSTQRIVFFGFIGFLGRKPRLPANARHRFKHFEAQKVPGRPHSGAAEIFNCLKKSGEELLLNCVDTTAASANCKVLNGSIAHFSVEIVNRVCPEWLSVENLRGDSGVSTSFALRRVPPRWRMSKTDRICDRNLKRRPFRVT